MQVSKTEHYQKSLFTPIYKTGDCTEATNYRPVSLISNIAKIY